jgi:phosphate uptake regulator
MVAYRTAADRRAPILFARPSSRDLPEATPVTIEQVKATIRAGNDATEHCGETLRRAAANAAETTQLARQTVHDSTHDEVEAALNLLDKIAREVELTLRQLTTATDHANRYLAELG